MTHIRATAIAALLALVPATTALAEARPDTGMVEPAAYDTQSRGRGDRDRDSRESRERGGGQGASAAPRADLGAVVRRVSSGRDGRMLGVSPRGDVVVVRWEYPGGRVADITVDARSGRILGER